MLLYAKTSVFICIESEAYMQLFVVLIPFLGTVLGSAMVFLMRNQMNKKVEKLLLGFASGVMVAASVWSLLIPSIEMAKEQESVAYFLSFAAGAMIYVVVEELIPESQAGDHSNIGTIGVAIGFVIMMILDVALRVKGGICHENKR